jgi:hypothetical protein
MEVGNVKRLLHKMVSHPMVDAYPYLGSALCLFVFTATKHSGVRTYSAASASTCHCSGYD